MKTGRIVALSILLYAVATSTARAEEEKSYSREELQEIFSQEASLTFAGDIEVRTYDFEHDGKHVQALLFRPPGTSADARQPALLLVPGYQRTAIDYIRTGLRFARAGYVCVAVTQPGFGTSDGPSDWVGPQTIATLRAGLERMIAEPFVDTSRIGLYGFSRGAFAVSILAVTPDIDVKAVIAASGGYDFKKTYDAYSDEGLQSRIKANMEQEAGLSPEAIDARTSIDKMQRLTASLLVIHGRKDVNVPVEQAEDLIRTLEALDKDFEFRIYDDADHGLGGTDFYDVCLDFLARKLSPLNADDNQPPRSRARTLGLILGTLEPGPHNDITDVAGVRVGHYTLRKGTRFNTGITAILQHGGNLFLEKVPAAIFVGNGFGKLAGSTQVTELGEIETPILLTGTLNVPKVADGLMKYMLSLPGMEQVFSINPVVGETNDGFLSDIRARPLGAQEVRKAIEAADAGPVVQGAIGAGTGTRAFGFKGGIGSASRKLGVDDGGWTVGVLVQSNFGGALRVAGVPGRIRDTPLGEYLRNVADSKQHDNSTRPASPADPDGSLMIVIATDAPLGHRNLERLAERSLYGMARTGGFGSNGSGDYAIAFSTHAALRIRRGSDPTVPTVVDRPTLDNSGMTPLFLAVTEATEEAIIDSLFTARTTVGHRGTALELPVDAMLQLTD